MDNTIEIPADAKTVTLKLNGSRALTLRALLPQVKAEVELVVIDEFGVGVNTDADLYRLRASCGDSLLRKLRRSRVVEGESLLDLTPDVKFVDPTPTTLNGTVANLSCTGGIQLLVKPPIPDNED